MYRWLPPIFALVAILAGCGGPQPPAGVMSPTPASSPAGNWSGTVKDAVSGDGTLQLSLAASTSATLSGTWSATFRTGDRVEGPAVATRDERTAYGIILHVAPPPPCTTASGSGASALLGYTLVNLAVSSTTLSADLARLSCSGVGIATITLSKQ
jgi:hypothetical protein